MSIHTFIVVFFVVNHSACSIVTAAELVVPGVIRAQEEVVIKSELTGIVQRIAVKEGDRVKEGQLLVELRNDRQKIAVDLARARAEKATASLSETKVLLSNAEKDFGRMQIAKDAVPRKDFEDKADQVDRLKAILQAQQAEVAQAKEEIRLRENEVKDTQLTAPFNGTVTQIFVKRGESLKPSETQVLEVVDLDRLYAEILLPVAHVHDVNVGQKVTIHAERDTAKSVASIPGQVSYINPKVDASSRTFLTKVGFANAGGRIRPGMLAQVVFPFAKK